MSAKAKKEYSRDEIAEADRAFAHYVAMDVRSLRALSVEIGVSFAKVKEWSRDCQWASRLGEFDAKVTKQLVNKAATTKLKDKERCINIVNRSLDYIEAALESGTIEFKSAQDIEKLIKLNLLLLGEATDKTVVEGGTVFIETHLQKREPEESDTKDVAPSEQEPPK